MLGMVFKNVRQIMSSIIIVGAAVLAFTLAVFIGLAIVQEPAPVGLRRILRGASVAAIFIVMAFMMISYVIRKFSMNGRN